jgi:hypothetical protein
MWRTVAVQACGRCSTCVAAPCRAPPPAPIAHTSTPRPTTRHAQVLGSASAVSALRSVEALGPLRAMLMPIPLPMEMLTSMQPAVALSQEDRQVGRRGCAGLCCAVWRCRQCDVAWLYGFTARIDWDAFVSPHVYPPHPALMRGGPAAEPQALPLNPNPPFAPPHPPPPQTLSTIRSLIDMMGGSGMASMARAPDAAAGGMRLARAASEVMPMLPELLPGMQVGQGRRL